MKKMILIATLLFGLVQYTESVNGVYYPNCYEVDDATDMGLEMLIKGDN